MLRRAVPFALSLIVVLVVAFFFVPRLPERLEGTLSDMPPEDALTRLRTARAAQDMTFTVDLDMLQARLEREARNWPDAARYYRAALERAGPNSAAVMDELATTALLSGDETAATDWLRRAYRTEPTPDRRMMLGRRLRVTGNLPEETSLLSAVPLDRLSPAERTRLAELLFGLGDADRYTTHLEQTAALRSEDAVRARADLLVHYAGTGRRGDGVDLVRTWPGAETTAALVRELIASGFADLAGPIAADAVARHPDSGAAIVTTFADAGSIGAGLQAVSMWLSTAERLTADDWTALVGFALRGGELSHLHRAIRAFPGAPPNAYLTILRYEGAAGLLPYRGEIPPDQLAQVPLLAAGLSAATGNRGVLAADLIAAADAGLSDWDKAVWASLVQELNGTPWLADVLRSDLPPGFAQLAADTARQGDRVPIVPEPVGPED